jgi:hypothetical protein
MKIYFPAMVTKESEHVSKLSLFLDILPLYVFSAKRKWLERGRKKEKLLRK